MPMGYTAHLSHLYPAVLLQKILKTFSTLLIPINMLTPWGHDLINLESTQNMDALISTLVKWPCCSGEEYFEKIFSLFLCIM